MAAGSRRRVGSGCLIGMWRGTRVRGRRSGCVKGGGDEEEAKKTGIGKTLGAKSGKEECPFEGGGREKRLTNDG